MVHLNIHNFIFCSLHKQRSNFGKRFKPKGKLFLPLTSYVKTYTCFYLDWADKEIAMNYPYGDVQVFALVLIHMR